MRFRLFILSLICVFSGAFVPAYGELQDIAFDVNEKTARVLFSFAAQPNDVKVFVTEHGLDVDILGIDGAPVEFASADDLFGSIRQISAPGGMRIRVALHKIPTSATAEVFHNSILVTANFTSAITHSVEPLVFAAAAPKHTAKPKHVAKVKHTPNVKHEPTIPAPEKEHNSPPKTAQIHTPAAPKMAAKPHGEPNSDHDAPMVAPEPAYDDIGPSGHDGDPKPKRAPVPAKAGQGMIREASLKLAESLSEEQCHASEQAVSEDPWALDNLARFGACMAKEGKIKDAREVFERLLTFDPEIFAAYVGLGAIAQDAGEFETARKYYEDALSLGGSDAEAAQARALLRSLGEE